MPISTTIMEVIKLNNITTFCPVDLTEIDNTTVLGFLIYMMDMIILKQVVIALKPYAHAGYRMNKVVRYDVAYTTAKNAAFTFDKNACVMNIIVLGTIVCGY
jgi:hypothetical protein